MRAGKFATGSGSRPRTRSADFSPIIIVGAFMLDEMIRGMMDASHTRNRDALQAYAEQVLMPKLAAGDIFVMDNLGSHRGRSRALLSRRPVCRPGSSRSTRQTSTPSRGPFFKLKEFLRDIAALNVDNL